MEEKKTGIQMLLVPVWEEPRVITVEPGAQGIQDAIGCEMFECAYDERFGEIETWHYINDSGKIKGARPNRAIYSEGGTLIDIIYGDFLISASDYVTGDTIDLPTSLINQYKEHYRDPLTGLEAMVSIRVDRYLRGVVPFNYGVYSLRYSLTGRNLMREYMQRYKGEDYYSTCGNSLERWLDYWLDYRLNGIHRRVLHGLCFEDPVFDRCSDILVPLWYPLKMSLQLSSYSPWYCDGEKTAGEEQRPYGPDIFSGELEDIKNNLEKYLPRSENQKLYRLAALAELDYNVWVLADYAMQSRFERNQFYDQLAPSIAALFPSGYYYKRFFETEEDLYGWIRGEGVDHVFYGDLEPSLLNPVISGVAPGEKVWPTNTDELNDLLDGMIKFLELRAEIFKFGEIFSKAQASGV